MKLSQCDSKNFQPPAYRALTWGTDVRYDNENYSIALYIGLGNSIQLFRACLANSQNYTPRCRGQLNALLPEAAMPRSIAHWAVHGTEVNSFEYSTKHA